MAILTNRSDVISNFVRYYGRQPSSSEDLKTVEYLTTKAPKEVESLLAKNSPITGGKLWGEYNKTKTSGSTTTNTAQKSGITTETDITAEEKANLDKAYAYIDASAFDEASKTLLKQIASQQYTSGTKVYQSSDLDKIISDAALAATSSLDPYYTKTTAREIEDLKNKFSDIRSASERYMQQDVKSYAETLKETKQSLMKSGRTFSSASRDKLGAESAASSADVAGIEGSVPQQRRYNIENQNALYQQQARDLGISAERKLGSSTLNNEQSALGSIADPYNGGITYNPNQTTSLYKVNEQGTTGYVSTGDLELERLKEIEKAKQERIKALYL